jgi:hypothetical protein
VTASANLRNAEIELGIFRIWNRKYDRCQHDGNFAASDGVQE